MISIILLPPGIEYVRYLREFARYYDVFIVEVPDVEGVRRYLNGEIDFDQLLYEIEYFDVNYAREFYGVLRELNKDGIDVLPIDPYGLISMKIRIKAITGGLSSVIMSNEERYIAYMETKIAEAYKGYNSALFRRSFDDSVRWIIRYARLDAERIKFRSELRARELTRVLGALRGRDVLIHTDHYNEILAEYLGSKLMCMPSVVRLSDVISRKLGVKVFRHPGLALTHNYLYGITMDENREYLLGAQALIYTILRMKVLSDVDRGSLGNRAVLIDNSLIRFTYNLGLSEARRLFHRLMEVPKDAFRVRLRRA
ncbi:hypothetical protein [Vulcanisaeta souniana]|uniref:Uncharacterized protein n=1 Tax=Vulcanisaeta souniana JCM 11219 TaxID=1293586 RepID=A0A830EHK3_9CREN|nr:hypothetical protein [Vulcanisaeta souniana]BDR93466.1 hypothetical protein Vsou_25590 [Vulcanisaeta souniana JCM 11219]GGI77386.1 hypothetical protein GCM10007112_12690 [Vulcanisaeta souniana JCM 11219]